MEQLSLKFAGWTLYQRCEWLKTQLGQAAGAQDCARLLVDATAALLWRDCAVWFTDLPNPNRHTDLSYVDSDSAAVYALICPSGGEIFRALERIAKEAPHLRLELTLADLPQFLSYKLMHGTACDLLKDRFNAMAMCLYLSPTEYWLLNFALHVHFAVSNRQSVNPPQDSLYSFVSEDYLHHFLPVDILSDHHSLPDHVYAGRNRSASGNPAFRTPLNLFRKDFYQKAARHGFADTRSSFSEVASRAQAIVQLFGDVWLSMDAFSASFSSSGFSTTTSSGSRLPHPQLIRSVRTLVKYVHYFVFHPNQAPPSLQDLKAIILPRYINKPLYHFLGYCFRKWPLDGSFSYVEETWLSYIQPWRYAFLEKEPVSVATRWESFFYGNFLLFATPFSLLLDRLGRMDLRSRKNVFILYRLVKTLSIPNFWELLRRVDTAMQTASKQRDRTSPDLGRLLAHLSNIDPSASNGYQDGFVSGVTKEKATQVLISIAQAVSALERAVESSRQQREVREAGKSWFQRFWEGIFGSQDPSVTVDSDNLKIIENLNACSQKIGQWFGVSLPRDVPVSFERTTFLEDEGDIYFGYGEPDTFYDRTKERLTLSPRGRFQVVNGLCRADKVYLPQDALPRKGGEVPVEGVNWADSILNESFTPERLDKWYHTGGFRGMIARLLVLPSTSEMRRQMLSGSMDDVVLPPRISVRAWAKIHVVLLIVACLFWRCGWMYVVAFVLFLQVYLYFG